MMHPWLFTGPRRRDGELHHRQASRFPHDSYLKS